MHLKLTFAFLEEPTFSTIAKIFYMEKHTTNLEICNGTKFSSLAESTKNQYTKINLRWKIIRLISLLHFLAWHN